jgi:Spy/CpxP family protein refolding chaperone
MKLNKTLMIAALVAGSVFAADYAVRAQDSTNTPPAGARPPGAPGARGRMNFDNIATQLNLTDDQKEKAKPVFQDMMQKMMALRQDTSVAPADRGPKMKEIRDEANTKLKEIFTPEQYDKWMKMSQGRGRGGAGTPPPAGGTTTTPPAGGTTPPQ